MAGHCPIPDLALVSTDRPLRTPARVRGRPGGATRRQNPPSPGHFFLLDSDSYWSDEEEVPEYDPEWIMERCDLLHAPASEFFTVAVTDRLRDEVFNA